MLGNFVFRMITWSIIIWVLLLEVICNDITIQKNDYYQTEEIIWN